MRIYEVASEKNHSTSTLVGSGKSPPARGRALGKFLELRGKRVFEAAGVIWANFGRPFYGSLPYNLWLEAEKAELTEVMRKENVACLRYPSLTFPGLPSGIYVCCPQTFQLESLAKRDRAYIRQGLERCEVRQVEPHELLEDAMELNLDTLARQKRFDSDFVDPKQWEKFVYALERCPEFFVTGAFVSGRLAAYIVGYREDGGLHLLYKMSRTRDMVHRVSYALDYNVISVAARSSSVSYITNGCAAIISDHGLDRYKRHIGYSLIPFNLNVRFHPAISPWVCSRFALAAVRTVSRLRPQDERPRAAEMVLRAAR